MLQRVGLDKYAGFLFWCSKVKRGVVMLGLSYELLTNAKVSCRNVKSSDVMVLVSIVPPRSLV